ncbi:hypothetical protein [Granulicella sp. L60]|uniref:hypothetical protein n=1 Tax=Granulicella sp. L60 TaxID=1641866 RepID=UPI00131BD1EC|nr:hypothetical protein [Granulicella sp. L60]
MVTDFRLGDSRSEGAQLLIPELLHVAADIEKSAQPLAAARTLTKMVGGLLPGGLRKFPHRDEEQNVVA